MNVFAVLRHFSRLDTCAVNNCMISLNFENMMAKETKTFGRWPTVVVGLLLMLSGCCRALPASSNCDAARTLMTSLKLVSEVPSSPVSGNAILQLLNYKILKKKKKTSCFGSPLFERWSTTTFANLESGPSYLLFYISVREGFY